MITLHFSFRSLKNDSSCCFHNTRTIALHNFAWEGREILKNDKTQKLSYIPVIPPLPFTTLPSVISAQRLGSHSHGQKPESSSCKEKVITSVHLWANCSNSAVNQRSTPASELICVYHGCLLDRFSQASWSRENVFNDSITPKTHFLQITFALCVCCLRSIWKTSNEQEDVFLFLSTYSNRKENTSPQESTSDGEAWA